MILAGLVTTYFTESKLAHFCDGPSSKPFKLFWTENIPQLVSPFICLIVSVCVGGGSKYVNPKYATLPRGLL